MDQFGQPKQRESQDCPTRAGVIQRVDCLRKIDTEGQYHDGEEKDCQPYELPAQDRVDQRSHAA
jgi:hypothetical protein